MKQIITILAVAGLLAGCAQAPSMGKATVYKSPSCTCCAGYVSELERQGFDVDVVQGNVDAIKQRYHIPAAKQSCHTTVIGNYVIEGHVPMQAVKKLLAEQPDVDGIGLPGMPIGTPGMPGPKTAPYRVYALTNGKTTEWMTI